MPNGLSTGHYTNVLNFLYSVAFSCYLTPRSVTSRHRLAQADTASIDADSNGRGGNTDAGCYRNFEHHLTGGVNNTAQQNNNNNTSNRDTGGIGANLGNNASNISNNNNNNNSHNANSVNAASEVQTMFRSDNATIGVSGHSSGGAPPVGSAGGPGSRLAERATSVSAGKSILGRFTWNLIPHIGSRWFYYLY